MYWKSDQIALWSDVKEDEDAEPHLFVFQVFSNVALRAVHEQRNATQRRRPVHWRISSAGNVIHPLNLGVVKFE